MKTTTYFTASDVKLHCTPSDIWVSMFGQVLDLTNVVGKAPSDQVDSLIRAAGTDISHWFDAKTKSFPIVENVLGKNFRLPAGLPMLDAESENPWWKNQALVIGVLGTERPIQVLNTLTNHRHSMNVCEQETIGEIVARYARFNSNAFGYRWRFDGKDLDMSGTLTQNGILDERATYLSLGWPQEQWYVPAITLVWKDQMI